MLRQRARITERWTAYALTNLAVYLSPVEQAATYRFTLDTVLSEHFDDYVAEALEVIAPKLPPPYLREAFVAALELPDSTARLWALTGLLPYLDAPPNLFAYRHAAR